MMKFKNVLKKFSEQKELLTGKKELKVIRNIKRISMKKRLKECKCSKIILQVKMAGIAN